MRPYTFFISYRREDTGTLALLLKYEIEKRLQFVRVVVDVTDISPGTPFPARIRTLIDESDATIALIGKDWMPEMPGDQDWVWTELQHSVTAPVSTPHRDDTDIQPRAILPVFVDMPPKFSEFPLPDNKDPIVTANALSISSLGWSREIGPLLDEIAVTLDLKKRPDADEYPPPDISKARTQAMSDDELLRILAFDDYDGWYIDNFGNNDVTYLCKTFRFRGFTSAARFMALVTDHCRVVVHHPEWRNVFNHVTVSLTTWDAKRRVTIYDLNLALFMNKAAEFINDKKTL